MNVNKYRLMVPNLTGTTGIKLNVPVSQISDLAGQEDTINRDFVAVEVENAINPIFDYEKVKFLPKNISDDKITKGLLYKLNFLGDDGAYVPNSYWSNLDMTFDDFKFRKNGFIKSFLRLDFYDTDINSTQRLLFFVTIFPKFNLNDLLGSGAVPHPSNYDVTFRLGNTLLDRRADGEGFGLYHFKDEVIPTVPKALYMRATFANAKTGKTTRFMSSNDPNISIDNLVKTTNGTNVVNNLHTRYLLKRDPEGYYYTIDDEYSNNVSNVSDNYTINLYEISTS